MQHLKIHAIIAVTVAGVDPDELLLSQKEGEKERVMFSILALDRGP